MIKIKIIENWEQKHNSNYEGRIMTLSEFVAAFNNNRLQDGISIELIIE